MARKIYVVGFAFPQQLNSVVLIAKTKPTDSEGTKRPDWLAQKFNGVGTDFDPETEEPTAAMQRTFLQRTAVNVDPEMWQQFHQLENPMAVVMFYKTVLPPEKWAAVVSNTSEPVHKMHLGGLGNLNLVSNLSWLIPMALDKSHNFSMSLDHFALQVENEQPCILERYLASIGAYADAWEKFRQQTHAHLDPSSWADNTPALSQEDALLLLTRKAIEVRNYQAALATTFNMTEAQVHMVTYQASTFFDEFPIDTPKAIELATKYITDTIGTLPAANVHTATGSATSTEGSSENAGEGSSDQPGEKQSEGGVQNTEQPPLPPREPGQDLGHAVAAGSGEAGTTNNTTGQDPVQNAANTPGTES